MVSTIKYGERKKQLLLTFSCFFVNKRFQRFSENVYRICDEFRDNVDTYLLRIQSSDVTMHM